MEIKKINNDMEKINKEELLYLYNNSSIHQTYINYFIRKIIELKDDNDVEDEEFNKFVKNCVIYGYDNQLPYYFDCIRYIYIDTESNKNNSIEKQELVIQIALSHRIPDPFIAGIRIGKLLTLEEIKNLELLYIDNVVKPYLKIINDRYKYVKNIT